MRLINRTLVYSRAVRFEMRGSRQMCLSPVTWDDVPFHQLPLDMAEIEVIESDVRRFLLPSEEAKIVAECVIVHSPQLSDLETKPVFVEERIKRVLAVISHTGNAHQTHEQGW